MNVLLLIIALLLFASIVLEVRTLFLKRKRVVTDQELRIFSVTKSSELLSSEVVARFYNGAPYILQKEIYEFVKNGTTPSWFVDKSKANTPEQEI